VERITLELTLTSSETAALLDVHPSTVKRWCNDGELPFDTTHGGHRRIRLADAVELARKRGIETVLSPFHPYEPHVWEALQEIRQRDSFDRLLQLAMGWIVRGRIRWVALLFDALAREELVPFHRFADEAVAGLMERVGVAWAEGRLRVAEEHVVSQAMTEVLLRLTVSPGETLLGSTAPVAVVGTLEGNQHHIGALVVRVALERRGWEVCYLGPDVPVEDFDAMQRSRDATLVCVSLPPPASGGDVARVVRVLGERYDAARPYALAIGGQFGGDVEPGLLTGAFTSVGTFGSCEALEAALERGFAPEPAVSA
jgi:excisionase family DNA binding protein